ncbi:MAG TPA: hypothetical protein VEG44_00855 [Candidatus Acidoferrales bacterium]|nr:hypothetical protein [Candidatus Acidoferrales bacterium]
MFMLMPPLWPAIPLFLIASMGMLFVPISNPLTGAYTVVVGGASGIITPLVAAMALVAVAF